MSNYILEQVRIAASKRILYLPHAIRQMLRPDRMISREEVEKVIFHGEVIEDYPGDPRGHSCLIFYYEPPNRPIHVVCSPKGEYLAIITTYIPDPAEWSPDFKRRL